MNIDVVMNSAPVIPVLVPDGSIDPVQLASTLVEAGLPVIEVTLRTPSALDAIKAMKSVPGAVVGVGTVLNSDQLNVSLDAGAEFIVSPGMTPKFAEAALASGVPFLPGTANASDIMLGLELGLTLMTGSELVTGGFQMLLPTRWTTPGAAGTSGDCFHHYVNGEQKLTVMLTRWESVRDADEFQRTLRGPRRTAFRFGANLLLMKGDVGDKGERLAGESVRGIQYWAGE